MKKMRPALCVILVLIMLSTPIIGFAEESTSYDLDDVGISISLPASFIGFTRDMPENSPQLSAFNMTKQEMTEELEAHYTYLLAYDSNLEYEVYLMAYASPLVTITGDFSQFGKTALIDIDTQLIKSYQDKTLTVSNISSFNHIQTNFIKEHAVTNAQSNTPSYGLSYATGIDNTMFILTVRSLTGSRISSTFEKIMDRVVNSIHFSNRWNISPLFINSEQSSTSYTDNEFGVTFNIPAGWDATAPLLDPSYPKYIKQRLIPGVDLGTNIMYGAMDLWTTLTEAEKAGLNRTNIDNAYFRRLVQSPEYTDSALGKYCGTEVFHGVEFEKMSGQIYIPATKTWVDEVCFIHLRDGYMYAFYYTGSESDFLYTDFVDMMDKVQGIA